MDIDAQVARLLRDLGNPEPPLKSLKLLEDIRDAASFIRQATESKTLDDYRRDRLVRQAVERNFEIIDEAVGD